jgi:molybdenum cofactor synthesis domain-containing protein
VSQRVWVLTISDSVSAGEREDRSGPALQKRLREDGWDTELQVLPDDPALISRTLRNLADAGAAAVFTTGGTGIALRGRTPEATKAVLDFEIPGLSEQMRLDGRTQTPFAALSRGVAGVRGRTLIVNLPGSPSGAVASLASIAGILRHAMDLLEGRTQHLTAGQETEVPERTSQH